MNYTTSPLVLGALELKKKEENLKKKQRKWGWIRDQISEKLTKKVNNFESINLA
jgi:hypothetical protein